MLHLFLFLRDYVLFILDFNPIIYPLYFSFSCLYWILTLLFIPCTFLSLLRIKRERKVSKRKRKHAVVFYALTGIWADLAFTSKAGPASRFSYARYGCLHTTLAVCALSYLARALFSSCKSRAFPLHGGGLGWGLVSFCPL